MNLSELPNVSLTGSRKILYFLAMDPIDREILALLQQNCRMSLSQIGDKVGLSAPSVQDHIRKLEAAGVIRSYEALLDARRLGLDVTAFIGVTISHPNHILAFLEQVDLIPQVQESHQVTGSYTLLLKVRARNTDELGDLLSSINRLEGVTRSETTIALSTHTERTRLPLPRASGAVDPRSRRARRSHADDSAEDDVPIPGKD